jgi:hypothetical protein
LYLSPVEVVTSELEVGLELEVGVELEVEIALFAWFFTYRTGIYINIHNIIINAKKIPFISYHEEISS